jgi:hypothetical protein
MRDEAPKEQTAGASNTQPGLLELACGAAMRIILLK